MVVPDSSETVQAEGEAPDGSDKPPHDDNKLPASRSSAPATAAVNGSNSAHTPPMVPLPTYAGKHKSGGTFITVSSHHDYIAHPSVPLLPPEAAAYPKDPGQARYGLQKLLLETPPQKDFASAPGSATPSATDSPSPSDCESWSVPSTRPPSQAPSRAPSMSAGVSGNKLVVPQPKAAPSKDNAPLPNGLLHSPPSRPRTASSVHSDSEKKFTLKDLIASAPKITRKSSQRSTGSRSSRKSDSDGGTKSVAGDSHTGLTQKYGVCQKVAIGKGATSVVRLAHKWDRSEEKLYAVKEFRKRRKNESEKEYVKKLTAEFCISSTLHHVNIVETVDLVQDESHNWCEVMEFCPGGDLYAAIKKGGMSPSEVECCFKQILCGVSYLHSQGVAHRDIKPENLFFDTKGHLKIGDYGASTVYRLPWEATIHMSTGLCGSEPYIAPEQFLGKPYDARLVDIWACGIVYYCLHFQEMPWRVAQPSDPLYAAYASACAAPQQSPNSFPPTINNLSPRACRSLIRKMLEPDPKQRSTIETIMIHPWVQSIEICHSVESPSHVHVHALALAQSQIQVLPS